MKVLVACEESQAVCIAFRERGHEAYSADIQECSGGHPEWHIQGDVLQLLKKRYKWDLMIGHPPCQYLSFAGAMHWQDEGRDWQRLKAMEFFLKLAHAPINKICLENPKGVPQIVYRPYDQLIHPYYFGDREMKQTMLWLKNLPKLVHVPVDDLFSKRTMTEKPEPVQIQIQKSTGKLKKRYFTDNLSLGRIKTAKEKSKTFPSIARAMAEQWG
jgi:hypothetical protein